MISLFQCKASLLFESGFPFPLYGTIPLHPNQPNLSFPYLLGTLYLFENGIMPRLSHAGALGRKKETKPNAVAQSYKHTSCTHIENAKRAETSIASVAAVPPRATRANVNAAHLLHQSPVLSSSLAPIGPQPTTHDGQRDLCRNGWCHTPRRGGRATILRCMVLVGIIPCTRTR